MNTFAAVILAYLIGNAAGIIEMAILGGHVDKWLEKKKTAGAGTPTARTRKEKIR